MLLALLAIGTQAVMEGLARERRPLGPEPTVTIYLHRSGERRALPLEQYVAGVVAAEMDPRWPVEALAAQAVIARTFAVERLQKGGVRQVHGTDVCDDPGHFQAYNPAAVTRAVRTAVARTRGLILVYDGQPAHAYYCAHSGGITADPEEGVDYRGMAPYLQVKPDPHSSPEWRWQAVLTPEEVRQAARSMGVTLSRVFPATIARRGPSGRAVAFQFGGKQVPAARFRLEVDGGMRVKSTLIDSFQVVEGRIVMSGRGFGHGVGLSQFGACRMASSGKDFRSILSFYYPGADLERRWR